ncbi:MAG: polyphosphate polymerase domain-containing protein [Bacteroides sp.]|nr:polyphosphate polymerase domain-containing protein [Bacteroides sp.]
MFAGISHILSDYQSVTLREMQAVHLMNRIDTKYVVSVAQVYEFFRLARDRYRVQEIRQERMPHYHTLYWDTGNKAMFHAHQLGRRVREKIRMRTYVDTGISFLEVKNKTNKGRTDKKRMSVRRTLGLSEEGVREFLDQYAWYRQEELSPHIENSFRRVTLVNQQMTERLTVDLGIGFHNVLTGNKISLDGLAVVEWKRDGLSPSPVREILRTLRIRPMGFSKYCIGSVLTDPFLRHNRMKIRLRQLQRIGNVDLGILK